MSSGLNLQLHLPQGVFWGLTFGPVRRVERSELKATDVVMRVLYDDDGDFFDLGTVVGAKGCELLEMRRAGSVLGPAPRVSVQLTPNWLPPAFSHAAGTHTGNLAVGGPQTIIPAQGGMCSFAASLLLGK